MNQQKAEKIHAEINATTIPQHLKLLLMMANATEALNQRCFARIKHVFALNGYVANHNDMLKGISNYCKAVKAAVTQFYMSVEPLTADATFNAATRQENDSVNAGARCYDQFQADANEICRLLMLYLDRTALDAEASDRVFGLLGGMPSLNIFNEEDISKFKLK